MRYRSLRKEDTISRWLSPVFHFEQGEHDSLCVYYSAAMLLLAFYPRFYKDLFVSLDKDPIFGRVSTKGPQSREQLVANWLFEGMEPKRVADALNRLAADENLAFRVEREQKNKVEGTFELIREDIDAGLPVLLCYDSRSLGHHAVVVTGYQIERQRSSSPVKWLDMADPGGGDQRQWLQLTSLSDGRLELLRVRPEVRLARPERYTIESDKNGHIVSHMRERYWCGSRGWGWYDADVLFRESAAGDLIL